MNVGSSCHGAPAANQAVALGHAPDEREQEREGVLGGRAREHVRRVRDHDPALARSVQVDVVEPDRVVRDDPERRPGTIEQGTVDANGRNRDETGRALGSGEQLEVPGELRVNAVRDTRGDEDGRLHETDDAAWRCNI